MRRDNCNFSNGLTKLQIGDARQAARHFPLDHDALRSASCSPISKGHEASLRLCSVRLLMPYRSVKDSRTKPSARIKSPAPVVLSAHFRPSMPKSVRPSLVKFGEAHRKTERQAKKRVKITILPQETPELADLLDLPIDINYLLMFFAELCSRWQLWHMRAEILDLLSPSQDHPLFHQQLQLMSGLDPQHLSAFNPSSSLT